MKYRVNDIVTLYDRPNHQQPLLLFRVENEDAGRVIEYLDNRDSSNEYSSTASLWKFNRVYNLKDYDRLKLLKLNYSSMFIEKYLQ